MKNDTPHTMTEQNWYHGKNKKKGKNLKNTINIIKKDCKK